MYKINLPLHLKYAKLRWTAVVLAALAASPIGALPALVAFSFFMASPTFAFDADGFHTGMTYAQVKQLADSWGLDVIGANHPADGNSIAIEQKDKRGSTISIAFCRDALYYYSRTLSVDNGYAQTLRVLLKQYGQPNSVESREERFMETDKFYQQVVMTWIRGSDQIKLSLTPKAVGPDGEEMFSQGANVIYQSKYYCAKS